MTSFIYVHLELYYASMHIAHVSMQVQVYTRLTIFPKECLVSDIPAGDGKMANLFLQCRPPHAACMNARVSMFFPPCFVFAKSYFPWQQLPYA